MAELKFSWVRIGLLQVLVASGLVAEVSPFVEAPRTVLGNTEASVERVLGKPLLRTVEKTENWHSPPALDDQIVLYYPGLTVFLRFARPVEKSLLTGLIVTDPTVAPKLGVALPLSAAASREFLGGPSREIEEGVVYAGRDSGIGEDTLLVVYRAGEVAALVWRYVID